MSENGSEVYLFRHGETVWNVENGHLVGGRSNHTPLTPNGEAQARALGQWCLDQGLEPTHVHVSPAVRTMATAMLSLEVMGLRGMAGNPHDDLQEMTHGEFEGKPRDEVYTPEVIAQIDENFKLDGGESMTDVGLRLQGWFQREGSLYVPGSRHFVYTHGYAIRCYVARLMGWSFEDIRKNDTPNASATKLSQRDGSWSLDYFAQPTTAEA